MVAYALITLRSALRSAGPWLLLGLGILTGWGGLRLSILALGFADRQAAEIILGTGQVFTLLTAFWLLTRALDADRASRLREAADCTRPGPMGRLLGRWAGAALAALVVGGLVVLALRVGTPALAPGAHSLSLYLTIVEAALQAAAWALLLALLWPGGPTVLLGLSAWFLGHLPWGTPHLLEGLPGRTMAVLLPGPRAPEEALRSLPATLLVTGGLLLLALAARRDTT